MRKHERGMSFWPFVVTLILLLIFVFMWFSTKSDLDEAVKRQTTSDSRATASRESLTAMELYLEKLTHAVGWQDTKTVIEFVHPTSPELSYKYSKPVSNVAEIEKALSPETEGGPLKAIRDAATVRVGNVAFKPKAGVQVPPAQFRKLPPNLKAKVDEVLALKPGPFPSRPDDQGDAGAVAKYEGDKKAWEDQFKKYSTALEAIVKEPGFEDYNAVLGEATLYDPEKPGVIDWSFYEKPGTVYTTLEEFMSIPAPILRNMRDSYIDRVKNDIAQIDSLTAAVAEKDKVIDNAEGDKKGLKQLLDEEQKSHSADVARLQAEAQVARDAAEKSRVAATGAETSLAQVREQAKTEALKLNQTIGAQANALAGQKERYNLAVARDEPDGALLSADPALGIAYVNLGSQDQLSVGTKFSVWVIGRGGQKVPKGDVVITKVLDSHYSQARISATALGERPLAPGDMISNPFYDKRKPIHVFLAGDLKKYPKEIAVARLAEMGAVVDSQISDKTDWIVLPDTVTAGESAAPAGGEAPAPDAAAPKEESPMARYERLARTFGATLVTERVLEAFLDY